MSKSRDTFYLSPEKQVWPSPSAAPIGRSPLTGSGSEGPKSSPAQAPSRAPTLRELLEPDEQATRTMTRLAQSINPRAIHPRAIDPRAIDPRAGLSAPLTEAGVSSKPSAMRAAAMSHTSQAASSIDHAPRPEVSGHSALGPAGDADFAPSSGMPQSGELETVLPTDAASPIEMPGTAGADGELHDYLNQLARLVANVTESYTAAVFLAHPQEKTLELAAIHTLSRDIVYQARIGYGCGLIGWTAENAVRISVCPFEHDATTLLYYHRDQGLKSFIAVPILDRQSNLLGVIACDSKKSYAFAKITEKILLDCATQAATLLTLHRRAAHTPDRALDPNDSALVDYLEALRSQKSEKALLELAANLPLDFVARDALVVITTDEPGASASAFYSASNQVRVGHRLLELVCRHKKVICSERSVQAQTVDDSRQRSFLSIPFHISKREAGSINLLSRAFEAFSAVEISTLERVAKVLGKELELIRLREKLVSPESATGLLTWSQFALQAKAALASPSAKNPKQGICLLRLAMTNLAEIEDFLGVSAAHAAVLKLMRLVEQAKGSSGIACYLYGYQILVLSDRSEIERIWGRLSRLLDRISLTEDNAFETAMRTKQDRSSADRGARQPGANLAELLTRGLLHVHVTAPQDGESLEELVAKSNRLLELAAGESSQQGKQLEVMAHASNW
ncbi:MAG: GAF domain-containing protein [Bdellovibrionota bacterium]